MVKVGRILVKANDFAHRVNRAGAGHLNLDTRDHRVNGHEAAIRAPEEATSAMEGSPIPRCTDDLALRIDPPQQRKLGARAVNGGEVLVACVRRYTRISRIDRKS